MFETPLINVYIYNKLINKPQFVEIRVSVLKISNSSVLCCINQKKIFSYNVHFVFNLKLDENKRRAQERLVTVEPVRTAKVYDLKPGHSTAAVLVPLCTVNNEPSLILTLRSTKLKKHRGQVR